MPTTTRTLLLGDPAPAEMRSVVAAVESLISSETTRHAPDVAHCEWMAENLEWFPDLIVVLQSWPDQFPAAEAQRLLALFPLARIVCCYGPWCDSDGRTRAIWPAAMRIPASLAVSRISRELTVLTGSEEASFLNWTASRTEIFDGDYSRKDSSPRNGRRIAILSPDNPWRGMMERAVRRAGGEVASNGETLSPDTILWDADPWDDDRSAELCRLRARAGAVPIIACVGFTRPDLEAALLAAGATRTCWKLSPFAVILGEPLVLGS